MFLNVFEFLLIILRRREEIEKDYSGQLQKNYDQPMYEVISAVFRGLSGRKITAPSTAFTRYLLRYGFNAVNVRLTTPCQSRRTQQYTNQSEGGAG